MEQQMQSVKWTTGLYVLYYLPAVEKTQAFLVLIPWHIGNHEHTGKIKMWM